MHIHHLRLFASDLDLLQGFYSESLGLRTLPVGEGGFAVQTGETRLEFGLGAPQGCYHFAWNIPFDAVDSAADWLEGRGIPLLPMEGERIVEFPNWLARSVYFHDPAGNILEFIGRQRIPERIQSSFGPGSILGISEMGCPSFDMAALMEPLEQKVGLPRFWNPRPTFCALGDDQGLFIVVDAHEKLWIPTMVPALPVPFEMQFSHHHVRWQWGMGNEGLLWLERA